MNEASRELTDLKEMVKRWYLNWNDGLSVRAPS
jgi:hypothetical protein